MNPKYMDDEGLITGRQVSQGEIIGKVATWGDFENGTSYHLHFNMQVITKLGWVWVNPYMSLVLAYERMIGGRGIELKPGDPAPVIPDKPPVILNPPLPGEAKAVEAKAAEVKPAQVRPAEAKPRKKARRHVRKRHRQSDDE
jgi:murein DD-endopeptidase MepM/ murein hydrolase activator NlpD